jgi:hypothetical protein
MGTRARIMVTAVAAAFVVLAVGAPMASSDSSYAVYAVNTA